MLKIIKVIFNFNYSLKKLKHLKLNIQKVLKNELWNSHRYCMGSQSIFVWTPFLAPSSIFGCLKNQILPFIRFFFGKRSRRYSIQNVYPINKSIIP